ncbi:MAG: hypothetical protein ACP5MT_03135 [Candidatus Acidifodinimicrobium sp.]
MSKVLDDIIVNNTVEKSIELAKNLGKEDKANKNSYYLDISDYEIYFSDGSLKIKYYDSYLEFVSASDKDENTFDVKYGKFKLEHSDKNYKILVEKINRTYNNFIRVKRSTG